MQENVVDITTFLYRSWFSFLRDDFSLWKESMWTFNIMLYFLREKINFTWGKSTHDHFYLSSQGWFSFFLDDISF